VALSPIVHSWGQRLLKRQLKFLLERQQRCCPLEIMLLPQEGFFSNSKSRAGSPLSHVTTIDYRDFAREKIILKDRKDWGRLS